jgi:hypothetical protein
MLPDGSGEPSYSEHCSAVLWLRLTHQGYPWWISVSAKIPFAKKT